MATKFRTTDTGREVVFHSDYDMSGALAAYPMDDDDFYLMTDEFVQWWGRWLRREEKIESLLPTMDNDLREKVLDEIASMVDWEDSQMKICGWLGLDYELPKASKPLSAFEQMSNVVAWEDHNWGGDLEAGTTVYRCWYVHDGAFCEVFIGNDGGRYSPEGPWVCEYTEDYALCEQLWGATAQDALSKLLVSRTFAENGMSIDFKPFAWLDDMERRRVESLNPDDRIGAAYDGLGLDKLIHDQNPQVRAAVASMGFGLADLAGDPAQLVRATVARLGFGLDVLSYDLVQEVRNAAAEYLDCNRIDLDGWIEAEDRRLYWPSKVKALGCKDGHAARYKVTEQENRATGAPVYNVQIHNTVDGGYSWYYAGNGRYCSTIGDVADFIGRGVKSALDGTDVPVIEPHLLVNADGDERYGTTRYLRQRSELVTDGDPVTADVWYLDVDGNKRYANIFTHRFGSWEKTIEHAEDVLRLQGADVAKVVSFDGMETKLAGAKEAQRSRTKLEPGTDSRIKQ